MFLTLAGAASALRRTIGIPLGFAMGHALERHAETASASLDESSARAAVEKGRTWSVTQMVEHGLGITPS